MHSIVARIKQVSVYIKCCGAGGSMARAKTLQCLPFLSLREVLTKDETVKLRPGGQARVGQMRSRGRMLQAEGTACVKAGSEQAWCIGDWIWEAGSRVGDRDEKVCENPTSQGLRSCEDLELDLRGHEVLSRS